MAILLVKFSRKLLFDSLRLFVLHEFELELSDCQNQSLDDNKADIKYDVDYDQEHETSTSETSVIKESHEFCELV